ncbi:MAG: glycosyltransferase, partial [Longimicrobiales bacterium]
DIAGVLKRCDIVAIPSHWEGFGLVAAEALAAGKPVVASNTSSLPEIVRDEQEGLLIPPRDVSALSQALIHLLHAPELRARFGQAGAQRALTRFSHARMIEEYEALLARFATQR